MTPLVMTVKTKVKLTRLKKFTKRQFKELMECLSSAIGQLRVNLNNTKKNSLLLDKIMNEYNGIARMTSHGGQLQLIHHDGDDNDASSNDDDESDNADDNSSQGSLSSSDSSEHDSGNSSDTEFLKGSNGTAESDRVQKKHWATRSMVTMTLVNMSNH